MSKPAARLDRTGWLDLGLDSLGNQGPQSLSIHRLCKTAGKTTGSFYHHFSDHDAFLSALMEHWAARNTDALIERTSDKGEVVDRLLALNAEATALSARQETGIRRLVSRYPGLQGYLTDIDNKRIDYLHELLTEALPALTPAEARSFAEIEYASFVGAQMLWPDAGPSVTRARSLYNQKLISVFGDE